MEEKSYKCESCGGSMVFDAASQTLKCEHCGHSIEILDDKTKVVEHPLTRRSLLGIKPEEKTSRTMECQGCGAKIEVYEDCTAVSCPYCGNSYVLAEKQEMGMMPDGVVPFKITPKQVGTIFSNWIKGRAFAPNALKTLYQTGKLLGIYLPYWTFDAQTDTYYTAMGGRTRVIHERGPDGKDTTRTVTDWFPTSGYVQEFFDDILIRASEKLDSRLLSKIEPFDTRNVNSYSPDYFAGYSAECFSRDLEDSHNEAIREMEGTIYMLAERDVHCHGFDQVSHLCINPKYSEETYKQLILPVYTTTYNYRDETYNVIINGQTGQISGNYPKSWLKIMLLILVIAAVIIVAVVIMEIYN